MQEKVINKCREMINEEKNLKREYRTNQYKNMSKYAKTNIVKKRLFPYKKYIIFCFILFIL